MSALEIVTHHPQWQLNVQQAAARLEAKVQKPLQQPFAACLWLLAVGHINVYLARQKSPILSGQQLTAAAAAHRQLESVLQLSLVRIVRGVWLCLN